MPRRPCIMLTAILSLCIVSFALAYAPPNRPPADPAIVFRSISPQASYLSVMNADGARKTNVLTTSTLGGFYYPCWSPDGSSVCFGISAVLSNGILYRGLGALDIGVLNGNPVGSNFRMLVPGDGAFHSAWSPDGTRIAYNLNGAIYSIPATGGTPTLLLPGVAFGWITWSPDSTRIAYGTREGSAATIRVLNVADGSTFEVCSLTDPNGIYPGQIDWGRTGGDLVFHTDSWLGRVIYTVAATAGATPLLVASSPAWFPTWSPDDTTIAYTAGSNENIVIRNLQTGAVTSTGAKGRFANWRRY